MRAPLWSGRRGGAVLVAAALVVLQATSAAASESDPEPTGPALTAPDVEPVPPDSGASAPPDGEAGEGEPTPAPLPEPDPAPELAPLPDPDPAPVPPPDPGQEPDTALDVDAAQAPGVLGVLGVLAEASPEIAAPGDTISTTITLTATAGQGPVTKVSVDVQAVAGPLDVVDVSPGTGGAECFLEAGVWTCFIDEIADGGTARLDVTGQATGLGLTSLGIAWDSDGGVGSTSVDVPVSAVDVLVDVTLDGAPIRVLAGDALTFTVDVAAREEGGPVRDWQAVLAPFGGGTITGVSATTGGEPGPTTPCVAVGPGGDGPTGAWGCTVDLIEPGTPVVLTVETTTGAPGTGGLDVDWTTTGPLATGLASRRVLVYDVDVTTEPDLLSTVAGGPASWVVSTVARGGQDGDLVEPALGWVGKFLPGPGLELESVTPLGDVPATCLAADPPDGSWRCTVETLDPDLPVSFAVTGTATGSGAATYELEWTTESPLLEVARAVEVVPIPVARLVVGITVDPDPVPLDAVAAFSAVVTSEDAGAPGVAVLLTASGAAILQTVDSPPGGTCDLTVDGALCQLGDLPVGASATITGTLLPTVLGSVVLSAVATPEGGDASPGTSVELLVVPPPSGGGDPSGEPGPTPLAPASPVRSVDPDPGDESPPPDGTTTPRPSASPDLPPTAPPPGGTDVPLALGPDSTLPPLGSVPPAVGVTVLALGTILGGLLAPSSGLTAATAIGAGTAAPGADRTRRGGLARWLRGAGPAVAGSLTFGAVLPDADPNALFDEDEDSASGPDPSPPDG